MNDIRALLDALNEATRTERSCYHLTLGDAIDRLADMPDHLPVFIDCMDEVPSEVMSYRGYYSDLAIAPKQGNPPTVADLHARLESALNETFTGYKGGDFTMGENTPLWVSAYGQSSQVAVMGLRQYDEGVVIVTKKLER